MQGKFGRYGITDGLGMYGIEQGISTPAVTYATWNPADIGTGMTLSNGNLTITNAGGWHCGRSTIGVSSGKWYWEYTITGAGGGNVTQGVGRNTANLNDYLGIDADGWSLYSANNKINNNSFVASGGATLLTGDIISVLLDATIGTLEFYRNGSTLGVAYASGVTGTIYAMMGLTGSEAVANFGATAFAYSVPSGYNAGLYT